MEKIAIIGTGFVGVVTAAGLADLGHTVIGVDIDEAKIDRLRSGHVPFSEPKLEPLVRKGLYSGRLSFTAELNHALIDTTYIIVAVPTPPDKDGASDLSFVHAAIDAISAHPQQEVVIIVKSTVPVGCFKTLQARLDANDKRASLVSCPEFLAEGQAVSDFFSPSRTVVGANQAGVAERVAELFEGLPGARLICSNAETAQLIKYESNKQLAMRVASINDTAARCEAFGADVHEVAKGMGMDPRIGEHFLRAGIGYGGSCFSKDLAALTYTARMAGLPTGLLDAVAEQNEQQLRRVVAKIREMITPGQKVAVFGLAFKPLTSDVRSSRAIAVVQALMGDYTVIATDPVAAGDEARILLPGVELTDNPWRAAKGAHCAAFLTAWDEYRQISLELLQLQMARPAIFDGPGIFDPNKVVKAGFRYSGIGRPSRSPLA